LNDMIDCTVFYVWRTGWRSDVLAGWQAEINQNQFRLPGRNYILYREVCTCKEYRGNGPMKIWKFEYIWPMQCLCAVARSIEVIGYLFWSSACRSSSHGFSHSFCSCHFFQTLQF
jgi:hypothetical protein